MKLHEIAAEIKIWSQENFGPNFSKREGYHSTILNSLCPLMGMGEEIGELHEAYLKKDFTEMEDAIGDVMIYMLDYMNRENMELVSWFGYARIFKPDALPVAYGKLLHANLKCHQGIRGFDNIDKYQPARDAALTSIFMGLQKAIIDVNPNINKTIYEITDETWQKNVKKRNWKKDQHHG